MLSYDVIIWDDNTPLFCFSWKLHSLVIKSKIGNVGDGSKRSSTEKRLVGKKGLIGGGGGGSVMVVKNNEAEG